MLKSLEKSNAPSLEEFQKSNQAQPHPRIFTGLTDHWTARTKWSFDFFKSKYGDQTKEIRNYNFSPYTSKYVTMKEYIEHIESFTEKPSKEDNWYTAGWNFTSTCPELKEDYEVPYLFTHDWIEELPANLRFGREWIFLSHAYAYTPIHTDTFSSSAWVSMISGKKTFRILPAEADSRTYKRMDLFDPKVVKDLEEEGFDVWEANLEPGDTLYIPGLFPHSVINKGQNIMVTKNFVENRNFPSFYQSMRKRLLEPTNSLNSVFDRYLSGHCDQIPDPDFWQEQRLVFESLENEKSMFEKKFGQSYVNY